MNPRQEVSTRTEINQRLTNLGWILDERDPNCNVTQGRVKTEEQRRALAGKFPDYVLYETGSERPIGIVEAKRPSGDLDVALRQAIEKYAAPLGIPLVFAFNDAVVRTSHYPTERPLKIDGAELQEFIDQLLALRFVHEGPEILSVPREVQLSRDELRSIFEDANDLLREEGLRQGLERFTAFADILFLKLVDEMETLRAHEGKARRIPAEYCWSHFKKMDDQTMYRYVTETVWGRMQSKYGGILEGKLDIRRPRTLRQIVERLDVLNLTATETEVKGDAFEYFIRNGVNAHPMDLGEYFTPRHIVRTMVHLIKPRFGERIYDGFCGTGGFLIEAFKYIKLRMAQTEENLSALRNKTVFGRELTSIARIAKMNMILFGDGHANVEMMDSLENPVRNQYDVVLTNIPYSQKTRFGDLYPIPSNDGNSVCVQHCFEALKDGGRAAILVPYTFTYEGGLMKQTRELIFRHASRLTVVDLPHGVFLPYTPTRANILYFEKGDGLRRAFFFRVRNDGFELNTKRAPVPGPSDVTKFLDYISPEREGSGDQAAIVPREKIEQSLDLSLRAPDYIIQTVESPYDVEIESLGNIVVERKEYVTPADEPEKECDILGVTRRGGVFLEKTVPGLEIQQPYKVVRSGDVVYNPYRVNIGSIGRVQPYYDGMLVSPAYVVFTSTTDVANEYILWVLRTERYRDIIRFYGHGSVRNTLWFEDLCRIDIPLPPQHERLQIMSRIKKLDKSLGEAYSELEAIEKQAHKYLGQGAEEQTSEKPELT
jgi:type I restriction enzyme M protein